VRQLHRRKVAALARMLPAEQAAALAQAAHPKALNDADEVVQDLIAEWHKEDEQEKARNDNTIGTLCVCVCVCAGVCVLI